MSDQESIISKICRGTTPFCIDLDDKDSYVIEVPNNDPNSDD
ncbi:hypothetical protein LCGC14_0372410 [marine sediment metagenome]|uniref:Uncharacterized protein n=1 Tax=marine sediment metagenome TaxID=412755 RepID=A0A0F9T4U6_9ZZZZ